MTALANSSAGHLYLFMDHSSERQHFRVVYPLMGRPRILIGTDEHMVVDCSEGGLRYEAKSKALPEVGKHVLGRVRFRRGVEVDISGRVVRVQEGTVALRLDLPGIPMAMILDEQRFLRTNFPMHG